MQFEEIRTAGDFLDFFEAKAFPVNGNNIKLNLLGEQIYAQEIEPASLDDIEVIRNIRTDLQSMTSDFVCAVNWASRSEDFLIVRRFETPIDCRVRKASLPDIIYAEICHFFNNFEYDNDETLNPFDVIYNPRYRQVNVDKRVNLAFIHFPKNAYDSKSFFRLIKHCCDPVNSIKQMLTEHRTTLNNITQDLTVGYISRESSRTKRGPIEAIRDSLDFGLYLGLLKKVQINPTNPSKTSYYAITEKGRYICDGNFIDSSLTSDFSIAGERERRVTFEESLLNYGISNFNQNITNYAEYSEMSARPFFVLLTVLDLLSQKGYEYINLEPYHLGFFILTVLKETDKNINAAVEGIEKLIALASDADRQSHLGRILANYTVYDNKLKRYTPLTFKGYVKRTNNFHRRMFGWANAMNWINITSKGWKISASCQESNEPADFTDSIAILCRSYQVKRIHCITDKGRAILTQFADTMYFPIQNTSSPIKLLFDSFNTLYSDPTNNHVVDLPSFLQTPAVSDATTTLNLNINDFIEELIFRGVLSRPAPDRLTVLKKIIYISGYQREWEDVNAR